MRRTLGTTEITVSPLCLGANVFGWTADENESMAVLDAYAGAGGNFIDTADCYSDWADGNSGGESETIIGRWLRRSGNRDRIVLATKVGQLAARPGLSADNINLAAGDSLSRLGTDYIDLYYTHEDDPQTPLAETLGALDALVDAGKIRAYAASNYTADRLADAQQAAADGGYRGFVALQPHYNLVHRGEYEGELAEVCRASGMSCVSYASLADGFLTGKYRTGAALPASERAEDAIEYLNDAGLRVLGALDLVAGRVNAPVAAVALAWLQAQPTVTAAIASARTTRQLADLLQSEDVTLSDEDLRLLGEASSATTGSRP
jgi:aryl-alcohol dehydrogenase (NADP+)